MLKYHKNAVGIIIMRLSVDEYCKKYKMSREMLSSKIKAKKLNYVVDGETVYIVVDDIAELPQPSIKTEEPQLHTLKPKVTVATVISLYEKENRFLKDKIVQLEAKIDKLVDDKEQLLIAERDRIEQIYSSKDEQLKNILELVNKKIKLQRDEMESNKVDNFNFNNETTLIEESSKEELVELKEYLKSLDLKQFQRKAIKKRFLDVYDSDVRIIQKNSKLYLDLQKYDYGDLING